jgi:hypothetical protein
VDGVCLRLAHVVRRPAAYGILFFVCSSAYVVAFLVSNVNAPRFERVELR